MARPAVRPIKLYGLLPDTSNWLANTQPVPSENFIGSNLSRVQILAILVANGIDEFKMHTIKKTEMVRVLRRLITDRGAEVHDAAREEELRLDQQQAENEYPRPTNCCVCRRRVSRYLFEICRHLCICSTCKGAKLTEQNELNLGWLFGSAPRQINCPVCGQRHNENELMRVIFNTTPRD